MSSQNYHPNIPLPPRWLMLVVGGIALLQTACGGPHQAKISPPAKSSLTPTAAEMPPKGAPVPPTSPPAAPVSTASDNQPNLASQNPQSTPGSAENVVPSLPAADPDSSERILLLTAGGPILLELRLTISGQSHQMAFSSLVDEALLAADSNGDGRPMWSELLESKKFRYGQYGNLPIADENAKKQLRERYDLDQDNVVDRDELPRLLTRNAGLSRAFSLRSVTEIRRGARRETSLWRLLDVDDDGALSRQELVAAPVRLRHSDADDDDLLTLAELQQPTVLDLENRGESRLRRSDVARLLGPNAQWESVQLALEERYALGGRLKPADLGWSSHFFEELDENHDGRIVRKEYSRFDQLPAQLTIGVDFAQKPEATQEPASNQDSTSLAAAMSPAKLRLLQLSPLLAERGVVAEMRHDRLVVQAAGISLVFFGNDTLAAENLASQVAQLLQTLDADKNGYLEEAELPPGAAPQLPQFVAADSNEDGKLYPDEITAFLRQQQAAQRAQIHARAEIRGDPLFGFVDRNSDDQLDPLELDAAAARLTELDTDSDNSVVVGDLPESLIFGLARGNIENPDELFRPPPPPMHSASGDVPRWFAAMDQNGDGSLSPREFLGEADYFKRLDQNGDGRIELREGTLNTNAHP